MRLRSCRAAATKIGRKSSIWTSSIRTLVERGIYHSDGERRTAAFRAVSSGQARSSSRSAIMSSWTSQKHGARIRLWDISLGVALLISWCGPANGDEPVRLQAQPPIAKSVAAFPRLVGGATPAVTKRINKALALADARIRKGVGSCKDDYLFSKQMEERRTDRKLRDFADDLWNRQISITMAGPRYLSFFASDEYFCGGPYPNEDYLALVFDLVTGALVDWGQLLPELAKEKRTGYSDATGTVGTISSPRLQELYQDEAKLDGSCADFDFGANGAAFIVWIDAKKPGLGVKPSLVHSERACGPSITIPLEILKSTEVSADFLQAFSLPQ